MKTIPLHKGSIDLPDRWEDLSFKQKMAAFRYLPGVFDHSLAPSVFRLLMLREVTGYKPQSGVIVWVLLWLVYTLRKPFVALYFFIRLGRIRFSGYWDAWIYGHRPKRKDGDAITFNLYRLSEQLDFAFRIEDNTIIANNVFYKTPFPYLKIEGRKFTGKKFIRDVAPFTNITGREFSDCFDLYVGYTNSQDTQSKERCLNKIISILYPCSNNHSENLVSDQADLISSIAPEIKFGILFWFSGIVAYYLTHEYYSLLFKKPESDGSNGADKVSLGMNGVVLMITKKGYSENDNINNFFDTQLKILQDSISEAIGKGAKIADIAKDIGLSISDINRLI